MSADPLTPDGKAVLLLCSTLGLARSESAPEASLAHGVERPRTHDQHLRDQAARWPVRHDRRASDAGTGGTWAGATENLKAGWVPLFVRSDASAPQGNRDLIAEGAQRVTADDIRGDLHQWLESRRQPLS